MKNRANEVDADSDNLLNALASKTLSRFHLSPYTKQLVALPTNRNKVTGVEEFHFQYIIELWFIAWISVDLHMCKSSDVGVCVAMCRYLEIKRVTAPGRLTHIWRLILFFKLKSEKCSRATGLGAALMLRNDLLVWLMRVHVSKLIFSPFYKFLIRWRNHQTLGFGPFYEE